MTIKQTIQVDVQSNLSDEAKLAKSIKDNLQEAAKVRIATSTASAKMAAAGGTTGAQSSLARGVGGLTGAAGRDFAAQQQGLGGLVRLYATYAANLFAVSAGFRALSGAMDTTNMVKGLDQLGAATGRNLGSIAKRLADLSDGAISLRESMQAVAQSTSAGMTSKNIERMGMVAKNASLALGVAMPDAISRISRGITKLEPELLDELGIMTKIEPAVNAYARSVGKAAGQLTDFERRQAFANAVLLEGEQKFGEIADLAANPYDRLLSTLKNVAQGGLEVLNKVLTPIVNLLASSPTALVGVLGVLGISLLKQALPALGEYKAGLASVAETASQLSTQKAADAKLAREQINKQIIDQVELRANKEIAAVDSAQKKIEALQTGNLDKRTAAYKILQKASQDVTQEDFKRLEASAQRAEDKKLYKEAAAIREVGAAVESSQNAEIALIKTKATLTAEEEAAAKSRFSVYGARVQAAEAAETDKVKKALISNAAYNASLIGRTGANKIFNDELEKSGLKLNALEKASLKARAGFATLTGAVTAFGAALNQALFIIGIIVTVLGILDSIFSTNTKQLSAFNSAVDELQSSSENVSRTLEKLEKQGGFSKESIKGIFAMSNAMTDLTDSTLKAVDAAKKAREGMGLFSRTKQNISGFLGFGNIEKDLAKSLGTSVTKSVEILTASGQGKEAQETFKNILGVDSLDIDTVTEAVSRLSETGLTNLTDALTKSNAGLGNTSTKLQNFKTAVEANKKAFDEFIISTANTNPMFRLGSTMTSVALTMSEAANGGVKEITAAFDDLAKSPEKYSMFGPEFTKQLVEVKDGFLEQANAVAVYKSEIDKLNTAIEKQLILDKKQAQSMGVDEYGRTIGGSDSNKVKTLQEQKTAIQTALEAIPIDQIEKGRKIFVQGVDVAFKRGAELISQGLGQAAEKAALTVAKARADLLTGPRRVEELGRLQQRQLDLQIQQIDTSIGLILSNERLKTAIELQTATDQKTNAEAKNAAVPTADTIKELTNAITKVQTLEAYAGVLNKPKGLLKGAKEVSATASDPLLKQLLLQLMMIIAPQEAAKTGVKAEKEATAIGTKAGKTQASAAEQAKLNEEVQRFNNLELEQLNILTKIQGITSKTSIDEEYKYKLTNLQAKQESELAKLRAGVAVAKLGENQEDIKLAEKLLKNTEDSFQVQERSVLSREKSLAIMDYEVQLADRNREVTKNRQKLDVEIELQNRAYRQFQVENGSKLLNLSEFYLQTKRNLLDTDIQSLEYSKNLIDITTQQNKLIDDRKLRIGELNLDTEEGREVAVTITEEYLRQNSLLETRKELLENENNITNRKLELTQNINTEQEKLNLLLTSTDNLADSLAKSFGDIGDALGDTVRSLINSSEAAKKSTETRNKLQEKQNQLFLDGLEDQDEYKSITIELAKLKDKDARRELTNAASLAASSKKFFNEKSKGYKAIELVEKALHLKRLYMDVKEFLTKIGLISQVTIATVAGEATTTAASTAGSMLKAIGKIPSVLMKFMEDFGWPGLVLGGVAIAAALSGGSSTSGVPGPTPEESRATVGTAMRYDEQGELVQTNAGVFGDTSAKSQSIVNSLEIIRDNSIEGLTYDNKMLRALESVAAALTGTAKAIYRIPGLVTGSIFGTSENSSVSGSFYGLGGITTTKEITDSGIQLIGMFENIRKGMDKTINLYEKVKTVSKNSGLLGVSILGGGTSTTYTDTFTDIKTLADSDKAQKAILGALDNTRNVLLAVAEQAGVTAIQVDEKLSKLPIDTGVISLRGLSGEDFTKALEDAFGNILDTASESIFSIFKDYQNFGEGMLETVIRVVDTNIKIKQALTNMGIDSNNVSFTVSEALLLGTDGLTDFLDKTKVFSDNFLTEAERLAPVQKAVTTEMARLGFSSITTRAQFKALVQGLDTTTKAGEDNFKALMNVQEGFIQVTEAAVDTTTALEDNLRTVYENRKKELEDLISGYGQVSKTLTDLRSSLLMGAESTLSPSEKYALAKKAYEATLVGTKSTDPKIALASMQQLSTTGKDFLAISRVLYASSARYVSDFDSVIAAIDASIPIADIQAQTAQDQLTALESMVGTLIKIDAATSTSADVEQGIKDYLTTKFGVDLYNIIIASMGEGKLTTATGLQEVTDALSSYNVSATQKVLQAYKDTFGKTGTQVDVEGLKYWVGQVEKLGKLDQAAFQSPLSQPLIDKYGKETYDAVVQAYGDMGRTGGIGSGANQIDVGGLEYWMQQMTAGTFTKMGFLGATDLGKQILDNYFSTYGRNPNEVTVEELLYWINKSTTEGKFSEADFQWDKVKSLVSEFGQTSYDTVTEAYKTKYNRMGVGSGATQIDFEGLKYWMDKYVKEGKLEGFARGGIASGWAMVGEEGPELVNFTNPGRVYSANDTQMMMGNQSNGALLEEIRNLRMEVQELRKEQNSQTGAIINSNYNANLIASENIGEAMKESAQQAEWAARSMVVAK